MQFVQFVGIMNESFLGDVGRKLADRALLVIHTFNQDLPKQMN